MDDLDTGGMLAFIDAEIAKAERETRERVGRLEASGELANAARMWDEFNRKVRPLREQRDLLITAMARVKSFETPPKIIVQNNP